LLKPLCETLHRTLEDLREEFGAYALRIVWIYRDPVNVFYSMHREGWVPFNKIGSDSYIEQWKKRNSLAHEFYQRHSDLIAIVRYEDFFVDSDVFRGLCDWLNIESKSFFQADSGNGRRKVPLAVQNKIDLRTAEILLALDALFFAAEKAEIHRKDPQAILKFGKRTTGHLCSMAVRLRFSPFSNQVFREVVCGCKNEHCSCELAPPTDMPRFLFCNGTAIQMHRKQ